MRFLLCFSALLLFLISCKNNVLPILSTDALVTQTFRINNKKDTVLKTANGAFLHLAKGSLTGSDEILLDVKEAYSFKDIIKAGLTMQSNGQPLRSGGMIYMNARNENVKFVKPIQVSVPTKEYTIGMNLFKGEEKDGGINWVEPRPLTDSIPEYVKKGQAIFAANCATCHALDKVVTGPALRGVEHRGPWSSRENLFAWTRNPGGFIPLTNYTKCLAHSFGGQIMPSFPQLSDSVLNAVYDYIKFDEIQNGLTYYRNACEDSCRRYDSALLVLAKNKLERQHLINDNGPMTQVFYKPEDTTRVDASIAAPDVRIPERDLVTMEDNRAEYYKFSVTAFGWYNLDMLLKEVKNLPESILTVQLQGDVKTHVDIYLAIPSIKLFTKAGRTNNADEFAFDTKDGKLPLPQNVKAYVFAMSEREDGVLFAYKEFTTAPSQMISIEVRPSTKQTVYALFDSLHLDNVSIKVEDSKNASAIRSADKRIKELNTQAEALRPKTCNCSCQFSADSTIGDK